MAGETPEHVQISKGEYETLMAIKGMMDKAWDSRDDGAAFRSLLKKVNPELKTPDDLAASTIAPIKTELDQTNTTVKGLGDKLDKFLDEYKTKEDTAVLSSQIDAAVGKFGLDDDGRRKMLERMKEKNSFDVEAAAAYIASQAPKPKPVSDHGLSGLGPDLFGTTRKSDEFEALHTGGDPFRPGGWFDQQAMKILNETPKEQAAA